MNQIESVRKQVSAVYQRGEDYIEVRKFRIDEQTTTVDSATIKIYYPCDSGSTTTDLELDGSTYKGKFEIPSDATYGEYKVEITATKDGDTSKFVDYFILLPFDLVPKIRSATGISQENDISDLDIARVAYNAYIEARDDIFKTHIHEKVRTDTCHCINGSNATFYLHPHIETDYVMCEEDAVEGHYIDCYNHIKEITASVLDAFNGKVDLKDESGNALCSSIKGIVVTYKTRSATFKSYLFEKAIVYLAAHEIILRFNELDKATLADLDSNKPIILANPDRMLKKYKQIVSKIGEPKIGGC